VFSDIKFKDMTRLIEYMYSSEIVIDEDDLDEFMIAAEKLRINGITPQTPLRSSLQKTEESSSDTSDSSSDSENSEPIQPTKKKAKLQNPPQTVPTEASKDSFPCMFCKNNYKSHKSRYEHQRICKSNPNRVKFKCSNCPASFTKKYVLRKHERTHVTAGVPNQSNQDHQSSNQSLVETKSTKPPEGLKLVVNSL
jgi:BTB/POZ domain